MAKTPRAPWLGVAVFITLIAAIYLADSGRSKHAPHETIERTPEGHLLIITDRREFIHRLCGSDSINLIGCARWHAKAPDPDCIIMILKGGGNNSTEAETLAHEKRHCLEGHFHGKE